MEPATDDGAEDMLFDKSMRPRLTGYDTFQVVQMCSSCYTSVLLTLALLVLLLGAYWVADAAEHKEHDAFMEARCVFSMGCEVAIGNTLGPTSVDAMCGGASTVLARCGLTSSASGISSSLYSDLFGSDSPVSPASPLSPQSYSAWYKGEPETRGLA